MVCADAASPCPLLAAIAADASIDCGACAGILACTGRLPLSSQPHAKPVNSNTRSVILCRDLAAFAWAAFGWVILPW
jgi:hypothetical protein